MKKVTVRSLSEIEDSLVEETGYTREQACFGHDRFKLAHRKAKRLNRIPAWADLEEIRAIYEEAGFRDYANLLNHKDRLHVDHIIPLCSLIVSGLHVSENLRIIDASENMHKGNKYTP